jgi:hypothetical protein
VGSLIYFHWIINKEINILTYLLHAESPSGEANQFSASQKIPSILWNPKVHYCIYKGPPPVPILIQINPVHAPIPLPEDHKYTVYKYMHSV